eukprot:173174-Amphidinium_carterae.2
MFWQYCGVMDYSMQWGPHTHAFMTSTVRQEYCRDHASRSCRRHVTDWLHSELHLDCMTLLSQHDIPRLAERTDKPTMFCHLCCPPAAVSRDLCMEMCVDAAIKNALRFPDMLPFNTLPDQH